MQVTKHDSTVRLDQCAYLKTVLERCGMLNIKPAWTSLPQGYILANNEAPVDTELCTCFQTVIGSLLYLMLGTRPNIAFAVTKLAQHSANPFKEHLSKVLYICCYLISTRRYYLEYDGSKDKGLAAFSDSDWGSDSNTCCFQTGFLCKLAGGVFCWTSRA